MDTKVSITDCADDPEVAIITDGEGKSMRVGKTTFRGETLYYVLFFPNIGKILGKVGELELRHDDAWLLTYPKSGTYWLHEIISLLLEGDTHKPKFDKMHNMVEMAGDIRDLEKIPSPRILNTHLRPKYLPVSQMLQAGNKVIVCLRNPKSVAVSLYHQTAALKYRQYEGTFTGYLPVFLQGGFMTMWGNWYQHVQDCWNTFSGQDNVIFVFYEDFKQNTLNSIEKLANFLGVQKNSTFYERVAKLTTFENMTKENEKCKEEQKKSWQRFKSGKNEIFRKGTIDDWKKHFTVAQSEQFDEIYDRKMEEYRELKDRIRFE